MAGTERWGQLSGSLVLLLVLTAAVAAAPASAASDGASPSLASAPPAAFAERIANRPSPSGASETSILAAIELIVLAAACAVAVAYYSAARERYDQVRSRRLTRRR
jgi:hypothetical protein